MMRATEEWRQAWEPHRSSARPSSSRRLSSSTGSPAPRTQRWRAASDATRGAFAAKRDSAQDLVKRRFEADGPNEAWFADITYVRTRQGWLYLAVVMDIWSRMVVGWSMGPNITARLADDALRMALARRRPAAGCVHHSDHGSQCTSLLLGKTMRDNGVRPSMGSISSPWDNAPTESLMGIIKSECVLARTFDSREQAALEIFDYIEAFCNRVRIHSALGWVSPAEFEAAHGGGTARKAA